MVGESSDSSHRFAVFLAGLISCMVQGKMYSLFPAGRDEAANWSVCGLYGVSRSVSFSKNMDRQTHHGTNIQMICLSHDPTRLADFNTRLTKSTNYPIKPNHWMINYWENNNIIWIQSSEIKYFRPAFIKLVKLFLLLHALCCFLSASCLLQWLQHPSILPRSMQTAHCKKCIKMRSNLQHILLGPR